MNPLSKWMRWTLAATTVYNMFGVLMFIPLISVGRDLIGWPTVHPFYMWLVTIWIGSFGVLYGWLAVIGRSDPAFLMIAAIGKFAFFGLNFVFWMVGDFPFTAPLAATGDLITAILFTLWLWKTRDTF